MKKAIETVDHLSPETFLSDYIARCHPVVVQNDIALQKAVEKWSLDYLVSKHPNHQIPIEYYADGDRNKPWTYINMDFSKYVEIQRKDTEDRKKYCLAEQPLQEVFPNTANDVQVPDLLKNHKIISASLFTGINTHAVGHYHIRGNEAILAQIIGKKRVRLYPPKEYLSLYPKPWYSLQPNLSNIPFADTNEAEILRHHPRFAEATEFEHTVQPGEMLFIPQGWFHTVEGIGETASVTFFFEGTWRHGFLPLVIRDQTITYYRKYFLETLLKLGHRFPPTRAFVKRCYHATGRVVP